MVVVVLKLLEIISHIGLTDKSSITSAHAQHREEKQKICFHLKNISWNQRTLIFKYKSWFHEIFLEIKNAQCLDCAPSQKMVKLLQKFRESNGFTKKELLNSWFDDFFSVRENS